MSPPTASLPCASSFSLISGSLSTVFSAALSSIDNRRAASSPARTSHTRSRPRSRQMPASCIVGTSGNAALRFSVETASAFSCFCLTNCAAAGIDTQSSGTWPLTTSVTAGTAAAVRDMRHLRSGA